MDRVKSYICAEYNTLQLNLLWVELPTYQEYGTANISWEPTQPKMYKTIENIRWSGWRTLKQTIKATKHYIGARKNHRKKANRKDCFLKGNKYLSLVDPAREKKKKKEG